MGLRPLSQGETLGKSQPKRGSLGKDGAEEIAVSAVAYVAADSDRLERFLALSGLEPGKLRKAAGEPGFLLAVLDHLCGHEPDLIAFAAASNLPPEHVAAARQILAGDEGWSG